MACGQPNVELITPISGFVTAIVGVRDLRSSVIGERLSVWSMVDVTHY